MPGRPAEQLLEVITFRRADRREGALSEYPLAQVVGTIETVRAEGVVLSVPDGRSVRTLINAADCWIRSWPQWPTATSIWKPVGCSSIAANHGGRRRKRDVSRRLERRPYSRPQAVAAIANASAHRERAAAAGRPRIESGTLSGRARAVGGSGPGGAGARHLPEQRRVPRRPRRPGRGSWPRRRRCMSQSLRRAVRSGAGALAESLSQARRRRSGHGGPRPPGSRSARARRGARRAHSGGERLAPAAARRFTFTVPAAGERGPAAPGRAAGPPETADRDDPPRASSSWTTTRGCCALSSSPPRSRCRLSTHAVYVPKWIKTTKVQQSARSS